MSGRGGARNAPRTAKEARAEKGATKVTRYRPGVVPTWAEDEDQDERNNEGLVFRQGGGEATPSGGAAGAAAAPVIVKPGKGDSRLQRLAGRGAARDTDSEDARLRHRRAGREDDGDEAADPRKQADTEDEEDEEEMAARRRRIRAAQLQAESAEAKAPAIAAPGQEADDEESEYYSSEYETDTGEDDGAAKLAKPVFVSRKDRATLASDDRGAGVGVGVGIGATVQTTWKSSEEVHKRQQETRAMIKEMAVNEFKGGGDDRAFDDVDTDDEKDKQAEYSAWKVRELGRLKLEWMAERNFREDEENLQVEGPKERGERAFMQKYYHKGAFFQSVSDHKLAKEEKVEEIYKKDYSAPTGEDKYNKAVLPKVMQRRNFGRRGQTKYTNLADQDTSKLGDDYKPSFGGRPRTQRGEGGER